MILLFDQDIERILNRGDHFLPLCKRPLFICNELEEATTEEYIGAFWILPAGSGKRREKNERGLTWAVALDFSQQEVKSTWGKNLGEAERPWKARSLWVW